MQTKPTRRRAVRIRESWALHPHGDRRNAIITAIRAAWRDERLQRWHAPTAELTTDLTALSAPALRSLLAQIRARIDSRPPVPELPRGWVWIACWQAHEARTQRTTAMYLDPARAVREARLEQAPPAPTEEVVQTELFGDEAPPM